METANRAARHRHRPWRDAAAICIALLLCQGALSRAPRGNYGWLADTPISKFNDADRKLLHAAAAEIIDAAPGATREWENPTTGNHGTLTLIAAFAAADGRPCRQVRVQNYAKGLSGDSKVTICKDPDRGWLLDTAEPPAG